MAERLDDEHAIGTRSTPVTAGRRRRALIAAAIGNGIEWFDFAAYGFVAAGFVNGVNMPVDGGFTDSGCTTASPRR
jgi:hypothetical protein